MDPCLVLLLQYLINCRFAVWALTPQTYLTDLNQIEQKIEICLGLKNVMHAHVHVHPHRCVANV